MKYIPDLYENSQIFWNVGTINSKPEAFGS
jgi:hypothetical protein